MLPEYFYCGKVSKIKQDRRRKAQIINWNAGERKRISTVWKNTNPGDGSTTKKYNKYLKERQQQEKGIFKNFF